MGGTIANSSRLIFLIFSVFIGLLLCVLSFEACQAFRSNRWPTTPGVVIAFYETPHYRYIADGKFVTNRTVSCNEFFNENVASKHSAVYAARYPLNSKVSVHYK